jgi:acyl carrier protein
VSTTDLEALVLEVVLDVARATGKADTVDLFTRLFDDAPGDGPSLGFDSMDALEVITILEERLDLEVDTDDIDFEVLSVVADIVPLVAKQKQQMA